MIWPIAFATSVYNLIAPFKVNKVVARAQQYTVSAVIPVYNEEDGIADTVHHVMAQDYPNLLNVFILDDRSTDNTIKICKQLSETYPGRIVYLRAKQNRGKAANLNLLSTSRRARLYSMGEILWCVDSDIRTAPNQLSALVDYFDSDNVGAVTGRCMPMKPSEGLIPTLLWQARTRTYNVNAFIKRQQMRRRSVFVLVGANFAIRRDLFRKYGMPKRSLTEDLDLCWTLQEEGYDVRVAQEVIAFSRVPRTFQQYYKQLRRWNLGTLQNVYNHRVSMYKSPALSFTTIIPGILSAYISTIFRLLIPLMGVLFGWKFALGMVVVDLLSGMAMTVLYSPKNVFHLLGYLIHAYIASFSWVSATYVVLRDVALNRSQRWGASGWKRVALSSLSNLAHGQKRL